MPRSERTPQPSLGLDGPSPAVVAKRLALHYDTLPSKGDERRGQDVLISIKCIHLYRVIVQLQL